MFFEAKDWPLDQIIRKSSGREESDKVQGKHVKHPMHLGVEEKWIPYVETVRQDADVHQRAPIENSRELWR